LANPFLKSPAGEFDGLEDSDTDHPPQARPSRDESLGAMAQLQRLTVRGFKSIRALEDFELGSLNVLIGANGAGKTNFISLFRMLAELAEGRLQLFVSSEDGPDGLLFGKRKRTPQMDAEFYFGMKGYRVSLRASGESLVFAREETWFKSDFGAVTRSLGAGHTEARLPEARDSFASTSDPPSPAGACITSTTRPRQRR
jgi:AAA domain, putative AbiEii toxin, Type IV TA system